MPVPRWLRFLSEAYVRLFTARRGVKVGEDRFGNVYYHEAVPSDPTRERRWVLYKGEAEASKVPPEWYGWLHHTMADPLPEQGEERPAWQRDHLPNLTGTPHAYHPQGTPGAAGKRQPSGSDYEAWVP